jgi:type IV secretory pathway TrbL component
MGESSIVSLTVDQLVAMHNFDKQIASALRVIVLICVPIIAAIGLIIVRVFNPDTSASVVVLLVLVWLVMLIYPMLIFITIQYRTGLGLHIINSNASWASIILALALLLVVLLDLIIPLYQGTVGAGSRRESVEFLILIPIIRYVFQAYTQTRADSQRNKYGERWLQLAQVSTRDILSLRIPHERA